MPFFVIPNTFVNNISVVDAVTTNANNTAIVNAINNIDNGNIGALGIYASQIKPLVSAQAIFGGVLPYVMPAGLTSTTGNIVATAGAIIAKGGVTIASNGLQTDTATGMGIYTGTSVPTFSAPNGTLFLRFDGAAGTSLYVNTSGASTSGTTWSSVVQASVSSAQGSGIITYTRANTETNGSPGVMSTATITTPGASPGPNGNWRVFVDMFVQNGSAATSGGNQGIGTATAGATPFALFAASATTHSITGGNCVSDSVPAGSTKTPFICTYSAIFANSATASFTALMGGGGSGTDVYNGYIRAWALPN